jgi:hypothetical protein
MTTLAEFLTARYNEQARKAMAASIGATSKDWRVDHEPWETNGIGIVDDRDNSVAVAIGDHVAKHIAGNDPKAVLADIASKRAVVTLHSDGGESPGYLPDGGYGMLQHACTDCGTHGEWGIPWPCLTLRLLGAVFDEHPDYREEWRP